MQAGHFLAIGFPRAEEPIYATAPFPTEMFGCEFAETRGGNMGHPQPERGAPRDQMAKGRSKSSAASQSSYSETMCRRQRGDERAKKSRAKKERPGSGGEKDVLGIWIL